MGVCWNDMTWFGRSSLEKQSRQIDRSWKLFGKFFQLNGEHGGCHFAMISQWTCHSRSIRTLRCHKMGQKNGNKWMICSKTWVWQNNLCVQMIDTGRKFGRSSSHQMIRLSSPQAQMEQRGFGMLKREKSWGFFPNTKARWPTQRFLTPAISSRRRAMMGRRNFRRSKQAKPYWA